MKKLHVHTVAALVCLLIGMLTVQAQLRTPTTPDRPWNSRNIVGLPGEDDEESEDEGSDDEDTVVLTILQTSDLHHHASGYGPFLDYTPFDTTDDDGIHGGYARLATLINEIRAEQAEYDVPVLLCNSGDFFMGTVYDLTASDPSALRFFDVMDYDGITLGNHEFDWSPAGLYVLLDNAIGAGFDVPVVATNMVTDTTPGTADDGLEFLIGTGDIVREKVIELPNGLKVGLIGLLGEDADEKAPVAPPVTFNHDYAFIQQLHSSSSADTFDGNRFQLGQVLAEPSVNRYRAIYRPAA